MSRRMHVTRWFVLCIVSLSAAVLGGCATDPQTAAAVAAGGLLGLQFGAMALTGSTLEVQIDMYAPTPEQYAAMRLDHPFAVTSLLDAQRAADDTDLLRRATPEGIVTISVRLQPIMDRFAGASEALSASRQQLRSIAVTEPFMRVADTLDAQANAATAAIQAWAVFTDDLRGNLDRLGQADVLDLLTGDLLALRVRLNRVARLDGVTPEYLAFMRTALRGALLQDAGPAALANVRAQINTALGAVTDDPTATGTERIAAILDALRGPAAALGANRANTDMILKAFGLSIDSAKLVTLPSREAIVAELAPAQATFTATRPVPVKNPQMATAAGPEHPPECKGTADVVVVQRCSAVAATTITLTLDRATADVNLGPISNEVQQVLQAAARGLGTITDPANEQRWRLNAVHAKSDGGPGNHNSIIYFENMGLPIVKNSTFDPTKFVVAQGTLFRHLFTGAVAAFGVPLPATAGGAGAADLQSSNVIATRARILNAEKAAAAARDKVIDALKASIDQQQKIKDGDWATKKADLVKAAQKALQDAAGRLEAVAGTD